MSMFLKSNHSWRYNYDLFTFNTILHLYIGYFIWSFSVLLALNAGFSSRKSSEEAGQTHFFFSLTEFTGLPPRIILPLSFAET